MSRRLGSICVTPGNAPRAGYKRRQTPDATIATKAFRHKFNTDADEDDEDDENSVPVPACVRARSQR